MALTVKETTKEGLYVKMEKNAKKPQTATFYRSVCLLIRKRVVSTPWHY